MFSEEELDTAKIMKATANLRSWRELAAAVLREAERERGPAIAADITISVKYEVGEDGSVHIVSKRFVD